MSFNFDIDEEPKGLSESELSAFIDKYNAPLASPIQPISSHAVIKRIIMSKTEQTIYPNGQTFYKTTSWEVGSPVQVKKKEKKTAPVQEVTVHQTEEY